MLQRAGDDTRIDWGYLYLAAPSCRLHLRRSALARRSRGGSPRKACFERKRAGASRFRHRERPEICCWPSHSTNSRPARLAVSRHVMIAYDELYSIKFLGRKLLPYWRRDGARAADLLRTAERDYESLTRRSEQFDSGAHGRPDSSRRPSVTPRWLPWLTARRSRAAASPPTATNSLCSSPRKTAATAALPRST